MLETEKIAIGSKRSCTKGTEGGSNLWLSFWSRFKLWCLREAACQHRRWHRDRGGFRTEWEHQYRIAGSWKWETFKVFFCVTSMLNGHTRYGYESGRGNWGTPSDANYPKKGFGEMKWVILCCCWFGPWPLYWCCQQGCQKIFCFKYLTCF